MRFAFNILDHRVSLSISKYKAPGVTFDENLQQASLVPFDARYDDNGNYKLLVDVGSTYLWTKRGNDSTIYNADSPTPLSATGTLIAAPFVVKASPTDAEMQAWDGPPPDNHITHADGIFFEINDLFILQDYENNLGSRLYNGIYRVTTEEGNYTRASYDGLLHLGSTVHVLSGTENIGKNFSHTADGSGFEIWTELAAGKMHLLLRGSPGVLVTASVQRVP